MEKADQELLLSIVPSDPDLKKLYDRHRKLEKEVENLRRYAAYSTSAALRQQELKKLKLRKMEEIMTILERHRPEFYPAQLN
jgi:uncharacterized protein YdcH (DUF465 family)